MADDSEVFTVGELLEEMKELDDSRLAIFGDCDTEQCSYMLGSMDRQVLYVCLDCLKYGKEVPAGICLACSIHCHGSHELLELYTKRNFCCDCGNSKFKEKCKLFENKMSKNSLNIYNQNFGGLYCVCHTPYSGDNEESSDMYQCIVCEDWFHSKHIDGGVPSDDTFDEFTCFSCMSRLSFLTPYAINFGIVPAGESSLIDVISVPKSGDVNSIEKTETPISRVSITPADVVNQVPELITEVGSQATSSSEVSSVSPWKVEDGCRLESLTTQVPSDVKSSPSFWPKDFREALCRCSSCVLLYRKHEVCFLIDSSDTLTAYEARGAAKREDDSKSEEPMSLQQISMETGAGASDYVINNEINRACTEFKDHFRKHLLELDMDQNVDVITKEHIEDIMAKFMSSDKRRRLE